MKLKTFIASASILMFFPLFAGEYSNSGRVSRIQINGWQASIIMDSEMIKAGCTYSSQYRLDFNTEHSEKIKLMYSTILSAYMAGKEVKFWLNGCHEDFPVITDVVMGEPL